MLTSKYSVNQVCTSAEVHNLTFDSLVVGFIRSCICIICSQMSLFRNIIFIEHYITLPFLM